MSGHKPISREEFVKRYIKHMQKEGDRMGRVFVGLEEAGNQNWDVFQRLINIGQDYVLLDREGYQSLVEDRNIISLKLIKEVQYSNALEAKFVKAQEQIRGFWRLWRNDNSF